MFVLQGVDYLYLNAEEYRKLSAQGSVICERVEPEAPVSVSVSDGSESSTSADLRESETRCRYRLLSIVGRVDGIGVENLSGSALVAGETARAYEQIPTYTLVSSRAVGIGSYLARLGRRVVQLHNAHIILTGLHFPHLTSLPISYGFLFSLSTRFLELSITWCG